MIYNNKYGAQKAESKDMVFGVQPIMECLLSGKDIDKLFVQQNLRGDQSADLIKLAVERGVPISTVPIEKLNRLTRKNHQGIIAFVSAVNYADTENIISFAYEAGKQPLIVVLDRITDVRNFGAIARSADCAGADAILVPSKNSAQIGGDALKTSAGALSHIPVCRQHNLKDAINNLKANGLKVVAFTEKAEKNLYEVDMTGPIAILMGSEEDGVSEEYLKLSDETAQIPMAGHIGSLNVSVAAGIVLFEAVRQRMTAK